jgi:hypothetical protein
MTNSNFGRLVHRGPAKPSLRERLTALKATASHAIRSKQVDAAPPVPVAAAAADPILAEIEESRRLDHSVARASKLPQPAARLDPLPEQDAAFAAFADHCANVLLKTVPTTAAGCAALARYALDYEELHDCALDEDDANNHSRRILDLIARSPMLGSIPTGRPLVPDFSGMSSNALIRTYNAFKMATDVAGLSTWTLVERGDEDGSRILDAEGDRLSHLQNDIVDELARRKLSDGWSLEARVFDTRIDRALACGELDEVAHLANEAIARGF